MTGFQKAGVVGFIQSASAYRPTTEAILVPLTEIEPVPRFVTHPKDWRGFDRARLVCLLKGFVGGDQIEPVPLQRLPVLEFASSPYRYRVLNGLHRYYGSIAAGFVNLPATI
jgi:hypothetical protein